MDVTNDGVVQLLARDLPAPHNAVRVGASVVA